MRKFYFFLFTLTCLSANAQNPLLVKTVSNTGLEPESDAQVNKHVKPWNGKIFYWGKGTATQCNLAMTDGTTAGTVIVTDMGNVGGVDGVYPAQDFVYLTTLQAAFPSAPPFIVTYTRRLWRTDGTAAGTQLLKAFPSTTSASLAGIFYSDALSSVNYSIVGNVMYFNGADATNGAELWKSDGTAAGTVLVKDINPGTANGNPMGFCRAGSTVCFFATDGVNAYQLWKTDGTAAGTSILTRINTTAQSIAEFSSGLYKDKMYFWANDGTTGAEVWYTDGTPAGTQLLKETIAGNNAFTGSGGARIDIQFIQDDRYLYFPVERYKYVWRTDGTTAGTIQLNTTPYASQTSAGAYAKGSRAYWLDGTSTMYVSNGTEAGTTKITDNLSQAGQVYIYKNAAWFQARPPAAIFDAEPWRSDGTAANTARAFDIAASSASSNPFGYFELNGFLYFFATNSAGKHLFRYNGDMTFNGSLPTMRWRDSANWNSAMPPGITDTVFIPAGMAPVVSGQDAYAGHLQMQASSVINLAAATDTLFINSLVQNGSVSGPGVTVLRSASMDTVRINGAFAATNLHAAGAIHMNAPLTVNTNFDLAANTRVVASGHDVRLTGTGSAITGAGPSAYIVTNGTGSLIIEGLGAGGRTGAVSFPVGTGSNYNPASITNAGSADAFRARVQSGVAPNYAGESASGSDYVGNVVNATWMIGEASPGGSDATITLQWNASQELPGFNRTQSQVGHYTGGNWQLGTAAAASGTDPYTRTASGISSFSPFSVFTGSGATGATAIGAPSPAAQSARLRQSGRQLQVDLVKAHRRINVQLFTMAGQLVTGSVRYNSSSVSLELPPFAGVYMLVLSDEKGRIYCSQVLSR